MHVRDYAILLAFNGALAFFGCSGTGSPGNAANASTAGTRSSNAATSNTGGEPNHAGGGSFAASGGIATTGHSSTQRATGGGDALGGATSSAKASGTGTAASVGGTNTSAGTTLLGGARASGGSSNIGNSAGTANSVAGTASATGGSASTTTGGASSNTGGMSSAPDVTWVKGSCSTASTTTNLETAEFCLSLTKASQTVASLKPKLVSGFDFAPADLVASRSTAGYFHLGDITLRLRTGTTGGWQNVTTASNRAAVTALSASGNVLAAADLSAALPSNLPLSVTRAWLNEGGRLVLRFTLHNKSSSSVQIGALGIPLVFNNVITNRTLDQAHAACSFSDPYIGRDAGYVQVTRLNGQSPALLVLPDGRTPLEAYAPILNAPTADSHDPVAVFTDLTARSQTFEGFHEWMVHTKAYADNEWSKAEPWNPATDLSLAPGQSQSYGVKFVVADQIRNIEPTLIRERRPVAVGVPGYILPSDLDGRLYLNYPSPVSSTRVDPPDALSVTTLGTANGSWQGYSVAGKIWGRSRLTITYADGTVQTVHYYVTKPAAQAVTDLGSFLTTAAWFEDSSDPFGRSPSVMTYDHELKQIVEQSRQAWVCGLGDDGGATWLAGAMKQFGQPDSAQVSKYQRFVDEVIWGGLQYSSGSQRYGVKRTLFYYEPSLLPGGYYDSSVQWTDAKTGQTYWGAWNKAHTLEVPRSYNYPHVAALYWTMYRLARNYTGLVSSHPWDWYLNQAYQTSIAISSIGNDYTKYGLMDGTVFLEILRDLQREGLIAEASDLESKMKAREGVWKTENYPFGSEMAWDSTGQEEVYAWTKYFGDASKAKVCLDAITGYMPTLPHWGYNGCARRYWDFLYGGSKTPRLERMIHHYGSSLNAIPVLSEYRDHPTDYYLLRIGYAGMMGSLSGIAQDGFPSMAMHAFPDTLEWDPISGDYGLNFFGHAYNSATYVINHPDFGWLAFGGNLSVNGNSVTVTPLDSFRKRVYLAPVGLWLTLDAGRFQTLTFDTRSHTVQLTLAAADANTPAARVRLEQPARVNGVGSYAIAGGYPTERGASVVPLSASATNVSCTAK